MGVTLIGGGKGILNFGPRTNPVRDKYWAERGLIHHEDTNTGEYQTLNVRSFLHRVQALSDMLGNAPATMAGDRFAHQDEVKRQMRFVELAIDLARLAKHQGMPSDADARKELKKRRATSVSMSRKYTF
jgi:hypothetical protein